MAFSLGLFGSLFNHLMVNFCVLFFFFFRFVRLCRSALRDALPFLGGRWRFSERVMSGVSKALRTKNRAAKTWAISYLYAGLLSKLTARMYVSGGIYGSECLQRLVEKDRSGKYDTLIPFSFLY